MSEEENLLRETRLLQFHFFIKKTFYHNKRTVPEAIKKKKKRSALESFAFVAIFSIHPQFTYRLKPIKLTTLEARKIFSISMPREKNI